MSCEGALALIIAGNTNFMLITLDLYSSVVAWSEFLYALCVIIDQSSSYDDNVIRLFMRIVTLLWTERSIPSQGGLGRLLSKLNTLLWWSNII